MLIGSRLRYLTFLIQALSEPAPVCCSGRPLAHDRSKPMPILPLKNSSLHPSKAAISVAILLILTLVVAGCGGGEMAESVASPTPIALIPTSTPLPAPAEVAAPADSTAAPTEAAPAEPAPVEPAPVEPTPVEPAPVEEPAVAESPSQTRNRRCPGSPGGGSSGPDDLGREDRPDDPGGEGQHHPRQK